MNSMIRALGLLAVLFVLATCGGGSDQTPPPPVVSISIDPTTASLKPGDAQSFAATVTGSTDTNVTWAVQEGAVGGSIDSSGYYTAEVNNGTYHVIATSTADSTKSAMATVTVAGTFVISPASIVLGPLGVSSFYTGVKVTWSVQEGAAGGVITAEGQYTAPNAPGMFHVVATSVVDPSKTVIANVTIGPSGFQLTGNMSTARTAHTATLLQSGKVLVTGGDNCYFFSYYSDACPLDSAEIYDPSAGTFATTGNMTVKRAFHTATLLGNGKVLVTGGPSASAELYDPTSGTFTATGSMSVARNAHTATLLANGKVLIVGGSSLSGELATAELYDSSNGTFTATGSMIAARTSHSATLLADGRVLIAGGINSTGELATAEVYDSTTGSFSSAKNMTTTRTNHVATLLANSNVLMTGGASDTGGLTSAEIYDSVAGSFTATASMMTPRYDHFAILLATGSVLVAGPDSTAELYDATSGSFTQTGSMSSPHFLSAAVLLPDGRVLVTGGSDSTSVELYK